MRPGCVETWQTSWQRLNWLDGWRRDELKAKALGSEFAVERLVQEGVLQFLHGGELAFVDACEVLGFFLATLNVQDNL